MCLYKNIPIDQLINIREKIREEKKWDISDEIRAFLDEKLIFIFDSKDGQVIFYLTESFFNNKDYTGELSKRKYLEMKISESINKHNIFYGSLYTSLSSIGYTKEKFDKEVLLINNDFLKL